MPGIYYIREIKAPDGYALDLEMKKIEVKMNEEVLLKVVNGKITVTVKNETIPEQPVKEIEVPVVETRVVEVPKLPVTGM